MNELIEQLREISDTKESAMHCGGTYSANNLRLCLTLLKKIEGYNGHPKYEKVLDALLVTKDTWQSALINHNSNKFKFTKFDIETGLPIGPCKNGTA